MALLRSILAASHQTLILTTNAVQHGFNLSQTGLTVLAICFCTDLTNQPNDANMEKAKSAIDIATIGRLASHIAIAVLAVAGFLWLFVSVRRAKERRAANIRQL